MRSNNPDGGRVDSRGHAVSARDAISAEDVGVVHAAGEPRSEIVYL